MDSSINQLFLKNFMAKVDHWERIEKQKKPTGNDGNSSPTTGMNIEVTEEQMVYDGEEQQLRNAIQAYEKKKEEEIKAGKRKKAEKKTVKMNIKEIFPNEDFVIVKGKTEAQINIDNPIFKHIYLCSLYLLWLLRLINIYFQNSCLFITEIKETIDSTIKFLSDLVLQDDIDIDYWIDNDAFKELLCERSVYKAPSIAKMKSWDRSKFDKKIFHDNVKGIVVELIKALKLRYSNPCFSWNMKSKKFEFDENNLELSYNDKDFKSLHNYHLKKYLEIFYLPNSVFSGKEITGNFHESLKMEIDMMSEWLKREENKNLIRVTGSAFKEGTLSQFIRREKKYSLLDVLGRFDLHQYPKLRRCSEFICSLQPNTSRVEGMFSVLRNTIQPNMYIENLHSSILLKLDRCGGVRKIYNN